MYTTIASSLLHYDPIVITNLTAILQTDIASGNGLLLSGYSLMAEGTGIRVRNKAGRLILAFQNIHPSLSAYARVLTSRTYYSLKVDDINLVLPSGGAVQVVGGFTNLFHAAGTEEVQVTTTQVATRNYSDFIEVMLAHDAVDPTGFLKVKAFYL